MSEQKDYVTLWLDFWPEILNNDGEIGVSAYQDRPSNYDRKLYTVRVPVPKDLRPNAIVEMIGEPRPVTPEAP